MPLPSGQYTLEELAEFVGATTNPSALIARVDIFKGGLKDMASRLANVEFNQLDHLARLTNLEKRMNEFAKTVADNTADRDTYKRSVDAATKTPVENTKRLDDLEKRIRAAEGAIGSTNYKPAADPVPAKPGIFSKPVEPVPA